jgi:hypothetical protein
MKCVNDASARTQARSCGDSHITSMFEMNGAAATSVGGPGGLTT